MCEPATIIAITAATIAVASASATAGVQATTQKQQIKMSKQKAKLEKISVTQQLQQQGEAAGQKNMELARAAAAARGQVKASNLGDRSVRAIGRAVGFELGQDKATVARNQEIASVVAAGRLSGINVTEASELLQIGDPGTTAALGAVNAVSQGLSAGASAYASFSSLNVPTDVGDGAGKPIKMAENFDPTKYANLA